MKGKRDKLKTNEMKPCGLTPCLSVPNLSQSSHSNQPKTPIFDHNGQQNDIRK